MKDGFIKVAAAAPSLHLADCSYNAARIVEAAKKAVAEGVKLLVTPELSLTGYTCGDLFFQKRLQDSAVDALSSLLARTASLPLMIAVGLPLCHLGKLYNCAALLYQGEILGVVPKTTLPNYDGFSELRWFAPASAEVSSIFLCGSYVPFGAGLLFQCDEMPDFTIGLEICEDLWVPVPPSVEMCRNGAAIIANLCANPDTAGQPRSLRSLVEANSRRCHCGYVLCNAGIGESSTDMVFSGQQLIAEDGETLVECAPFAEPSLAISEIDVERLMIDRRRINSYPGGEEVLRVFFSMKLSDTEVTRRIPQDPWLPCDASRDEDCAHIFQLQSQALARRLGHINAATAVIGVSGGLDSTLALLVAAQSMKLLGKGTDGVVAVTMPCFGTSSRTRNNAQILCEELGLSLRCVEIGPAVTQHFQDIGHDPDNHNVAFENAQARERTQVLMDLSNDLGGIVVGTGDFSELALGWATYNGDHMSMYGVNAGIPKTQVRQITDWYARNCGNERLAAVLLDILDTPVSPELLPPKEGQIAQKTEDLVGPYPLHDFFLYYLLRYGFGPKKIYRLACAAFAGEFDEDTIKHWLKTCFRRFFTQQYKRSCMPDGPMVGPLSLSPRGAWKMPSDAFRTPWQEELDAL